MSINLKPDMAGYTLILFLTSGGILRHMSQQKILNADIGYRGTQLKMTLLLRGNQRVVFKPKWYAYQFLTGWLTVQSIGIILTPISEFTPMSVHSLHWSLSVTKLDTKWLICISKSAPYWFVMWNINKCYQILLSTLKFSRNWQQELPFNIHDTQYIYVIRSSPLHLISLSSLYFSYISKPFYK